ncbi:DUF454 family protein [Yersinia ruckeri]|uniref:Inner membrane protein n=2 Tax=Enterobacterales TaxID=91347 RepID=A0A085U5D5_YERRU|nr:DUF454 family protein [Yersinia ruckeri]AJI96396.1 hypothetical protein BD65_2860 [Yersinia ruckeri]AKA39504.1 hypothetical protein UGYR_14670 [Yersinia ruckeri]ARZ01961.1 Inner membrane protein YbaN [Yersinia ruckeri]EEP99873.1 Inner membrane protein YbaN [Yersinia ruckeri ATCC 29473]EKN3345485.1 DUF454 family protein [Yersinia ruckeri]
MSGWLLIILGWIAVVLATLGVVLPLLPTTPFLLLATWCFARSSPRFHQWLLYRSWFGSYIRSWQQHRALPPGTKWKAVLVTVFTFAVSLWLVKIWWVRVLLVTMLIVLLIFMLRMPVIDLSQQKRR